MSTRSVDPGQASIYFQRGNVLLALGRLGLEHELWEGVGVTVIHAAIALTDALLIQERGLRSTSSNHMDLIDLLGHELPHLPDLKNGQKHLRHILAEKNRVEYEARVFTRAQAEGIAQHLERFVEWVNQHRRAG